MSNELDDLDFSLSFDEPSSSAVDLSAVDSSSEQTASAENIGDASSAIPVSDVSSDIEDLSSLLKEFDESPELLAEEPITSLPTFETVTETAEPQSTIHVTNEAVTPLPSSDSAESEIDYSKVFNREATPLAVNDTAPVKKTYQGKSVAEIERQPLPIKRLGIFLAIGLVIAAALTVFNLLGADDNHQLTLSKTEIKKLLSQQSHLTGKTKSQSAPAPLVKLHWSYTGSASTQQELTSTFRATNTNGTYEDIYLELNSQHMAQPTKEDIVHGIYKPWLYRIEAQDFVTTSKDVATADSASTTTEPITELRGNARAFVLNKDKRERIIAAVILKLTTVEDSQLRVTWELHNNPGTTVNTVATDAPADTSAGLFLDAMPNGDMVLYGHGEFVAPATTLKEIAHRDVTKFMVAQDGAEGKDDKKGKGKDKPKKEKKKKPAE